MKIQDRETLKYLGFCKQIIGSMWTAMVRSILEAPVLQLYIAASTVPVTLPPEFLIIHFLKLNYAVTSS